MRDCILSVVRKQGMIGALLLSWLIAGSPAISADSEASTELFICASVKAKVETNDVALAGRVCQIAKKGIVQFEQCDLEAAGQINNAVVSSIAGVAGNPLAVCRPDTRCIEIIHPSLLSSSLIPASPYEGLPPEEVFDSLIVHEIAHAILPPISGNEGKRHLVNEYVAYAFQLSSMRPETRKRLLDRYPANSTVELKELNTSLLQADPMRFGVKAWRHFSRPEYGCRFAREIISGRVAFPNLDR